MPFWQQHPNLQWLAHLRNGLSKRKERKEKSWEWETLTKTIPCLLAESVPAEWPLPASLGSQYVCNILLSLAALHLHWFQSFYDLNYTTDEICLPTSDVLSQVLIKTVFTLQTHILLMNSYSLKWNSILRRKVSLQHTMTHLVSRVKQASMKLTHLLHKVTQIAMRNLHLIPHLHLILLLLVPLWLPVQTWQLLILLFLAVFKF